MLKPRSFFAFLFLLYASTSWASEAVLREPVDPSARISIAEAQQLFFPQNAKFNSLNTRRLADDYRQASREARVPSVFPRFKVWQVEIDGEFVGFFFTDDAIGKQDRFDFAVATDVNNRIIGTRVLRYRESHGYEIMQGWWLAQFVGLGPEAPIARGQEIDGISGATLSVDHMAESVRRLVKLAQRLNPDNSL